MSAQIKFTDYEEPLQERLEKIFTARALNLANSSGMGHPYNTIICGLFGVLRKDPATKPRTRLFGLIKKEPLRQFIASGNLMDRRLILSVYGREHVATIRSLGEEIAREFRLDNVTIKLETLSPQMELTSSFNAFDCDP